MPRRTVLLLALIALSVHFVIAPAAAQQTDARPAATVTPTADVPQPAAPAAPAALDTAPSGESNPDPLTPPEVKESAPEAPGAEATPAKAPDAQVSAQVSASPVITGIRARLAERPAPSRNDDKEDLAGLKAFYSQDAAQSIWISADGGAGHLNDKALKAMAELRNANDWGLDAKSFELPEALDNQPTPEALADSEIKLSIAVLKYARYARGGRIDPPMLSPDFDRKPRIYAPKTVLQGVANAEAAGAYLHGLHPKHQQFERLRKALLADVKPTPPGLDVKIPSGPDVKPKKQHPHVALVRRRLATPPAESGKEDLYDQSLVDAVKAFQSEHDLKPNGVINTKLRSALNETVADTPGAERWRILANMERWRWMPDNLGDFYVLNNIPEQLTRVFEDGKLVMMEKIVVGKSSTPTPSFTANMQFVVFHPEWNVPDGIKTSELGPQLRRASGFSLFGGGNGSSVLHAHGLRATLNGREVDADSVDWSSTDIRRYQFTQPSGARNVLGVVKFRFPNKHDVYMHDTPERHLFGSGRRAFSHGCMRVQNPVHLAEVLLEHDKGWSGARVRELAAQGGSGQNEITLSKPIPVHIAYFTASVDDSGKVQTYSDIYGLDERVITALKARPMDVSAHQDRPAVEDKAPPVRRKHVRPRRKRSHFSFWD
jgi:L,D-transpeptidase YcbB